VKTLLGLLALKLLLDLPADLDPLQYALTVLVQLELGDNALRWVDTDWDGLTGGLLADDTLNVDDVFQTVD
jgi:hypothetical protein